jgi:O-antigen ligase
MACLLTGVRGAWLGILILCLLTTLFIREFRIPGVLILFFTAVIFISFPENRMSKRVHTAITMSTQSEQYRLAHWKANLELALKHPLTGIGYGSNRKPGILSPYLKKGVRHGPSHNEYIDILSSSGFTGLLLFLGVLFSPFFYIFKLMLKSEKKIKQTLLILLSFQIFIFTTIIFDRLSSIGWTCLMYSWLPTFWLMFTKQLSFTSLNPRR